MMSFTHRDVEDLKAKIHGFRVSDLQSLCSAFGKSRNGKKQDLQNRALEILSSPRLDILAFKRKVYELYRVAQEETKQPHFDYRIQQHQQRSVPPPTNAYMNPPGPYALLPQTRPAGNAAIYQNGGMVGGNAYPNATVYPNQMPYQTIQPPPSTAYNLTDEVRILNPPISYTNIKFKSMPFYRIRHEILKPSILKLRTVGRNNATQIFQVSFVLSCDIASDIAMHRDYSKGEYSVQAQLRMCAIDNSNDLVIEHDDMLPTGLSIRVNDKLVGLPPGVPGSGQNIQKRIPVPINFTSFLKLSPMNVNKMVISWTPEVGRTFVVCANVVEKLTSSYLMNKLKQKPTISVDVTKELIAKQYKRVIDDDNDTADAEDDDITPTIVRVSLQCPLAKFRMMYPAKGKNCGHLQCFDGYAYISCNEKKSVWMCPVCNRSLNYDDLLIDQYFVNVLASEDSSDCQEVQIFVDGTWKVFEEENVTDVSEKPRPKNSSSTSPNAHLSSTGPEEFVKPDADQKHVVSDNAVSTSGISTAIPDSFVDLTSDDDGTDAEGDVTVATDEQPVRPPSTHTENILAPDPTSNDSTDSADKIMSPVPVPDQSSPSLTATRVSATSSPLQCGTEPPSPGSPDISLRINTSPSSMESIEDDADLYSNPENGKILSESMLRSPTNKPRDSDENGENEMEATREGASADVVMTETSSSNEDISEIERSIRRPHGMQVSESDPDEDMPMVGELSVPLEDASTPETVRMSDSPSFASTKNHQSPVPNEMANLNIGN